MLDPRGTIYPRLKERRHVDTIKWFTCVVCGVLMGVDWKHDSPRGPLCPNCWRFHEADNDCVVREKVRERVVKQ